ncbi:hypothetical protein ABZ370_31810 [Streptomyces sp. NPDC005962]|uniref:hypothetical protein n=1 Tax=Streptomyces sp. NPDC005962 TaxID=3154466 RepID=UPI0033C01D4E
MTDPTVPACEQLLLLAADFTRHNDALTRLRLTGSSPTTALTHQTALTQHLAYSALHIVDAIDAQSMYHSPAIRTVYARVRQLAYLATDAADHLLDAVDILDSARAGLPAQGVPLVTYEQAMDEAGSRLALVRDLTALGAHDAVTAAELVVTDRRRRGVSPLHQPPALSAAQDAALRAIAQGEVTIAFGKPYVRRDDIRLSISTVRSLESRGLVAREPCPLWLHDERVHLTADGCRGLAATFGRPRRPALTAGRPSARPAATAARSATR